MKILNPINISFQKKKKNPINIYEEREERVRGNWKVNAWSLMLLQNFPF